MQALTLRAAALAASVLTLEACSVLDEGDDPPPNCPSPGLPGPSPSSPPGADGGPERNSLNTIPVAGWSVAGAPVLFDATTGAVLAAGDEEGPGGARDLVVDPWQSRVLVLEAGGPGAGGEVASFALLGGGGGAEWGLGPRVHEGPVIGEGRLAASPFGVVVLGDGAAPRWRLLGSGGEIAAPRPASLAAAALPDGRLRLAALTHGEAGAGPDVRVAIADEAGVGEVVSVPLAAAPVSSPPSTRRAESGTVGQLVDVSNGDVVVSTAAGSGWPAWMPVEVGPGITSVEQAVFFPGGGRMALLVSGSADVVVLHTGSGGAPWCAAALDLPGEVGGAGAFFTRGLVPVGEGRLLVATSLGVVAVAISGDCPPALEVDPAFAGEGLRGPIDGV